MTKEEEYRCHSHESRITILESNTAKILSEQAKMITEQALTNERLNTISKQLENGIKARLDDLSKNMQIVLPVITQELKRDSSMKIAIEMAIKTGIVAGVISVFGAGLFFIAKLYFNG
jgi:hypothetical protein